MFGTCSLEKSISAAISKYVLVTAAFLFSAEAIGIEAGLVRLTNDYPEVALQQPTFLQIPSGRDYKLKCNTFSCHKRRFQWEYTACVEELQNNCHYNKEIRWMELTDRIDISDCSSSVNLKNTSSNDTGFYRCSLIDEKGLRTREVEYFYLNVIEKFDLKNGLPPKLLEFQPTNITLLSDMKLVIQCKVYSIIPVEMVWFKEDQEGLPYQNATYLKQNSSQYINFEDDIYISKMIIEKTSEKDSGLYKCVALNIIGSVHKDAYVTILPQSDNVWQGTTYFSMLFFIPMGLALIPVTIWLCYYKKKKRTNRIIKNIAAVKQDYFKYCSVLNQSNSTNYVRTRDNSSLRVI